MKYWRKPLDQDRNKKKRYHIQVLDEQCKGCGWCIEFCPLNVIHVSSEFNAKGYHPVYVDAENECVDCGFCELICPEFALHITTIEEGVHLAQG